jgi:hypothetical protein
MTETAMPEPKDDERLEWDISAVRNGQRWDVNRKCFGDRAFADAQLAKAIEDLTPQGWSDFKVVGYEPIRHTMSDADWAAAEAEMRGAAINGTGSTGGDWFEEKK